MLSLDDEDALGKLTYPLWFIGGGLFLIAGALFCIAHKM